MQYDAVAMLAAIPRLRDALFRPQLVRNKVRPTSARPPLDLLPTSARSPLDLRSTSAPSPLHLRWISARSPLALLRALLHANG